MISEPKYKLLILEVYKIIGAIFALFILLLVLSLLIFPVKITLSILGLILIYIALVLSPFAQNIKKYGFRNALLLFQIKTKLQIQLLDSRIFVERKFLTSDETRFVKVPKIKIELNDDFKTGKLEIENSIKYSEKLKNLDVSAALKIFVSEEQFFTKDNNKLIIRIVDVQFDRTLRFNSMNEFINYWKSKKDRYNIFIDRNLNIKRSSMLVVGKSGSGKSYFLYSLLAQSVMAFGFKNVWILDPKKNSLSVLGKEYIEKHTGSNNEEILEKLEEIQEIVLKRKEELEPLLSNGLDKDSSDFGLPAISIYFDEYASFKSWLQTQSKERQNKAMATINLLILEGRQLGVHLIIAMQKSDATILPTHLRENMLFSLVLSNSGEQTYITAFGNEIASTIPERDREKGEGIYITDSSNVARTLRTPFLNFDIWQGYRELDNLIKKQKKRELL